MKTRNGETLSDKLDRRVSEIKIEKATIANFISEQYDEAKKSIGIRFTMKKESDIIYNFYFTGLNEVYDSSLHLESVDIEQKAQFTVDDSQYQLLLGIPNKINLKELSTTLINWARCLVDHELKTEETKQ